MPNKVKSPVLKMAQLMSSMGPEVKDTVMAIVNHQTDHPAVKTVDYFAQLNVLVARAILDIIITAVNERDPDWKKPGRPAKVKPEASPVVAGVAGPSPVVETVSDSSRQGKARK